MTAIPTLETERLILRPWRFSDLDALAAFYDNAADPDIAFAGGHMKRDGAWRMLCSRMGHWQQRGYGVFALEEKDTGLWAGWCGLIHHINETETEPELAYSIRQDLRGRGLATEAVRRVIAYSFETMRVPTLVAFIDPENTVSQRLALRLGAKKSGTAAVPSRAPDVWRFTASARAAA